MDLNPQTPTRQHQTLQSHLPHRQNCSTSRVCVSCEGFDSLVLADKIVGIALFLGGLGLASVVGLEEFFVASAVLGIDRLVYGFVFVV